MILTLIWLVAFVVILFLALQSWEGALGNFIARNIPDMLKSDDNDRWVWCVALAIIGATFIVNPVSMLLTLLLLALLVWLGSKLIRWGMSKAKTRK